MGKKSYDETIEDMKAQAQIAAGQQQQSGGSGGGGGLMSMLGSVLGEGGLEGLISGGGIGGGQGGGGMADAMSSFAMKEGGKAKKFEPHMMYDPKTGKGYKANKLADHLRMDKKGYTHKAQGGGAIEPTWGQGIDLPAGENYSSPTVNSLVYKEKAQVLEIR